MKFGVEINKMKIIDFLKRLILTPEELNSLEYYLINQQLLLNYTLRNGELEDENSELSEEVDSLQNKLDEWINKYNSLVEANKITGRHSSLKNYKDFLGTIPDSDINYDFGFGSMPPHKIFEKSLKDKELIKDFVTADLKFDGSKYQSADLLVLGFNGLLSSKYPTRSYYDYDTNLYGKREYWATAKETILKLRSGRKAFDCDDSMTLRYSCLYYLLKEFFPADLWRLRGFIVDLWSGGGHALLGWVKSGVNNFVPIETTFRDNNQYFIWKNDYVIENQLFYQIRYSFDENNEYVKI